MSMYGKTLESKFFIENPSSKFSIVKEIQMKILAMLLQQMGMEIRKMLTKEWVWMVKLWKLENFRANL